VRNAAGAFALYDAAVEQQRDGEQLG